MKNIFTIKRVLVFLVLSIMSLSLVSCNRNEDNLTKPKNELEEKGHDDWARVEIIIREGHLHGKTFHGNPISGLKILPREQKITFTKVNGQIVRKIEKGDNILRKDDEAIVVQACPDAGARYAMQITYYNNKNEVINNQFTTPEMAPIHQHFFTVKKYTDLYGEKKEYKKDTGYFTNLFDYEYRDTNPADFKPSNRENIKLSHDPIGLKGYFHFKSESSLKRFNMTVRLAHLYYPKYGTNKQTDPANNPSPKVLVSGATDFLQEIPFVVIALNGYSDEEINNFFHQLALYYQVNDETAEKLFNEDDANPESSTFYM